MHGDGRRGAAAAPRAANSRGDPRVLAELAVGITGTNSRPLPLDGTAALRGRPVGAALLRSVGTLVQRQVKPMRSTVTASHYLRLVAAATAQRLIGELAGAATPVEP